MFERDFLMREVKQIVELIAKIARLKSESKLEAALGEINAAYDRLGIKKSMLDYLDAGSLARMIGSPEALAAVGALMAEEAAILEAEGDPRAEAKRQRAEVLIAAGTVDQG